MDLITTWEDTAPTWIGGIGGVLSILIAAYALYVAIRAERRHIAWQLTNERKPDGRRSDIWRLVNTTSDVAARVLKFENVSDGLQDAVRSSLDLPVDVEPGNFLPFDHSRSMASPFPTIIRVTWQEGRPHSRLRRRKYTSTLFVD